MTSEQAAKRPNKETAGADGSSSPLTTGPYMGLPSARGGVSLSLSVASSSTGSSVFPRRGISGPPVLPHSSPT
jgi:predicted flavoprotein YhiN